MAQFEFYLMEYGSWIIAVILLLICLQQAVTLRRIKKAGRQLEQFRRDMIYNMDMLFKDREELKEKLMARERAIQEPEEDAMQKDTKEEQEKLLDAVLSEVFS